MQLLVCLSIRAIDKKQSHKPWCELQTPLWWNSAKTYNNNIWCISDFQERLDDNQESVVTLSIWHIGKTKTSVKRRFEHHCTVVWWQPQLHTKSNYTHRTIRKWITMTNMREQRTLTWGATSVVCQCGKFYKNHRGLRIHQTKSGCQICEKHQQCTDVPGDTGQITIQVNRLAVS